MRGHRLHHTYVVFLNSCHPLIRESLERVSPTENEKRIQALTKKKVQTTHSNLARDPREPCFAGALAASAPTGASAADSGGSAVASAPTSPRVLTPSAVDFPDWPIAPADVAGAKGAVFVAAAGFTSALAVFRRREKILKNLPLLLAFFLAPFRLKIPLVLAAVEGFSLGREFTAGGGGSAEATRFGRAPNRRTIQICYPFFGSVSFACIGTVEMML